MSLGLIEKKFMFKGEAFYLSFSDKKIKYYMNENDSKALIADESGNVKLIIYANASQNEGHLTIEY